MEDIEEDTLTFKPDELSTVLQVKTYSTYRIRVAAFTPKGLGPYSEYVLAGERVEAFTFNYIKTFVARLQHCTVRFLIFTATTAKVLLFCLIYLCLILL